MTADTTARAGKKCSARVSSDFGWHRHQCSRAGVVARDGLFFCKQHDPIAAKAKLAARDAKWKYEWEAKQAKVAMINAAIRSFEPMRDALKLLLADIEQYEAWQRPCHAVDVARAALALAEKTS